MTNLQLALECQSKPLVEAVDIFVPAEIPGQYLAEVARVRGQMLLNFSDRHPAAQEDGMPSLQKGQPLRRVRVDLRVQLLEVGQESLNAGHIEDARDGRAPPLIRAQHGR